MKYLFAFLPLLIFSCQNDQHRNRLDQEKMAEILVDIHLDEVKISSMEIISPDTNLLLYHQLEKRLSKNMRSIQRLLLRALIHMLESLRILSICMNG